ncbi:DUF257 family protein [Pyrococcus abyssi]|uniref:KaiC-like domain-containing protein n=1 Tax=Pyrococcus abyssi (strain GE5 / Orsay) TaxID=272844 RepID=Q9V1Z4_PYRAB|nr:DUF257 family protein [Pyrococcus abyssi]CAB49204.1 Hypothetical protein PAB2167 [Pyrococcus abyssi GE5]CCE69657.1 TPA: hypothetical protein PAB2167 [Pyrococcus abyssi GE5]
METPENVSLHIMDNVKFGETLLLEHDSQIIPGIGLYYILKWARARGYEVIIYDILDTLRVYRIQLELLGLDPSIVEYAKVIKEGGRFYVGNVVKRLSEVGVSVREKEYEKVEEDLARDHENIVTIVLGLEKLFLLSQSKQDIMALLNSILKHSGDRRRLTIYTVNVDIVKVATPFVIPLLEEIATTVIKTKIEDFKIVLRIPKSVDRELRRKTFKIEHV